MKEIVYQSERRMRVRLILRDKRGRFISHDKLPPAPPAEVMKRMVEELAAMLAAAEESG